jgi:hypothetical protein
MDTIIFKILRNKKGKIILPFFIFGLCGLVIEVCYRAAAGAMVGYIPLNQ